MRFLQTAVFFFELAWKFIMIEFCLLLAGKFVEFLAVCLKSCQK